MSDPKSIVVKKNMAADQDRMPRRRGGLVGGPPARQMAGHHVTFPRYRAMGLHEARADVILMLRQPLRISLSVAEKCIPYEISLTKISQ